MPKVKIALLALSLMLGFAGAVRADINSDPWQLSLYTISGTGSASSSYSGASIGGLSGSGGDVYLSNIGLNTTGVASTYSMYTGGNLNFNSSSSYNGGLSVGGNINYNSSTVTGNVQSGGNLSGSSGSIQGNVKLGGTNQAGGGLTISGSVSQNQPFSNPLNAATVNSYFQNASHFWAGLSPTASWTNVYGQIVVSALQAGRNIVNLTLANINSAWGIQLSGPSNAFVVFNITDTTGSLNAVTFNFSGGMNAGNVLFNLPNSTSLVLTGGSYASILAPISSLSFPSGVIQGNLIANTLSGSGSIQAGSFSGFAADQSNFAVVAPEPHMYLILASLLGFALYFKRKRVQTS